MRKINKIALFFFLFMTLLLVSAWRVIQSKAVSSRVSTYIKEVAKKELGADISFEGIELGIFPPATKFIKSSINLTSKDLGAFLYRGDLTISFDILYLLKNRLQISEVALESGRIEMNLVQETKPNYTYEKTRLEVEDFVNKLSVREFIKKIPMEIRKISITDVALLVNTSKIEVKNLDIVSQRKNIDVNLSVENVLLGDEFPTQIRTMDRVTLSGTLLDKRIRVDQFSVTHGENNIDGSASLKSIENKLESILHLNYKGNVSEIVDLIKSEWLAGITGKLEAKVEVKEYQKKITAKSENTFQDFKSPYLNAEHVSFSVSLNSPDVILETLQIKDGKESLYLKKSTPIYNLSSNEIIFKSGLVSAQSFSTNRALYYIREYIEPLRGEITGDVEISWSDPLLTFKNEGIFYLDDFKLLFDEKSPSILSNRRVKFSKAQFDLNLTDFGLDVDLQLEANKLSIASKGRIDSKGVYFESKGAIVDLEELGPISGTPLYGVGLVNFLISGSFDDVILTFDFMLDNFSVLDFYFNKSEGRAQLSLKSMELILKNVHSRLGDGEVYADGKVGFSEKTNIALMVKGKQIPYEKGWNALARVTKTLPYYDLFAPLRLDTSVSIGGYVNDLNIDGAFLATKFEIYGEEFDQFSGDFSFKNNQLTVDDIILRTGDSRTRGELLYDQEKNYFSYSVIIEKLRLKSIQAYQWLNLGLDGIVSGRIDGGGFWGKLASSADLYLKESKAGELPLHDSHLKVSNKGSDWFYSLSGIGGQVELKGKTNFDSSIVENNSELNLFMDLSDIRIFLAILSGHNATSSSANGKIKFDINSKFNLFNWSKLDLFMNVDDISLRGKDFFATVKNGKRLIDVEDGKIKRWDFKIESGKDSMSSVASGAFDSGFKIENRLSLRLALFEIFSNQLENLSGNIYGKSTLIGGGQSKPYWHAEISGESLAGRYRPLPGSFEKVSLLVGLENGNILIKRLAGFFGKGEFNAAGKVEMSIPYPLIDLDLKFENTQIPMFSRSDFVFSGRTKMTGKRVPYLISGDVSIVRAFIHDELTEFKGEEGEAAKYGRFIPKRDLREGASSILLDLNVNATTPVEIKNSLLEMYLIGSLKVNGPPKSPRAHGDLVLDASKKSKIMFKGNDFVLSEGKISLAESAGKIDPIVHFFGQSKISNYDVGLSVDGKTEKLDVGLRSDPPLAKEDILSLLTIGVTSETTKKLGDSDRQAVTSVGLGTLLADQFKLNQGIASFLGLKVSIAPEVGTADEGSLLQGRSVGGDVNSSRLKSSTKVKVEKKISEKVDLSVSSIVGGGLEQKQEMNLDFDLGKNVQLQGVYEVKPTEESKNPNSVGADIKFRIPFK